MADDQYLDVTLVFAPDGTVQAAVPGGATYEVAGPALAELLDLLGSDGAPIQRTSEPEKHLHEVPAQKVGISFASRHHR